MKMVRPLLLALGLMLAPAAVLAQAPAAAPAATPAAAATGDAQQAGATAPQIPADAGQAAAAPAAAPAAASTDGSLPGYTPMKPTEGIGMPKPKELYFQEQFTDDGQYAEWMNKLLLYIIVAISVFVLGLLVWVMVRYNRRANPVPSTTSHHTLIEIVWTAVPVLILVVIAVPSLTLLARQFEPAPKDAVTIKITGYQWYWGYTYPDNGGFEVISNMLPEQANAEAGKRFRTDNDGPKLLAVDNRMVVPAGVPLRIQTTAADVIHSFAVPALWFKLDAVPGRLNEKQLIITKPGVYFGQCSELCGARHGFMPIAVEALPPAQFAAWVKAQGGTMPGAALSNPSADPAGAAAKGVAPGATTDGGAAAKTQAATAGTPAPAAPAAVPSPATTAPATK